MSKNLCFELGTGEDYILAFEGESAGCFIVVELFKRILLRISLLLIQLVQRKGDSWQESGGRHLM